MIYNIKTNSLDFVARHVWLISYPTKTTLSFVSSCKRADIVRAERH